jgi:uncharacterized iron-regulated protein
MRLAALSFLALLLVSNCSYFERQPPLPSHAAIESAVIPAADAKFTALVQNADIIYFPSESVGTSGRFEAAWKLVEALQRDGGPFAVGWDAIDGDEQRLLDRWAKGKVAAAEVVPQLPLHGSAREVEICRRFLREAAPLGVQFLALRQARERRAATADSSDDAVLRAEQFAAATIARYFQANRGEKILVFFHRVHLGRDHGVPYLVAQKARARQLVLDSKPSPASGTSLLAGGLDGRRCWAGGSLEIVNGAPITASDLP